MSIKKRWILVVGVLLVGLSGMPPSGFLGAYPQEDSASQADTPEVDSITSKLAQGTSAVPLAVVAPKELPEPVPLKLEGEPQFFEFELASAAELLPTADGVMILSQDRKPGGLGAMIEVNDKEVPYIELRRTGALIDAALDPIRDRPGVFFVRGEAGEELGVRVPNRNGFIRPLSFVLKFPGKKKPDPDPEPPPGSESLTKLSRARADVLDDSATRSALREALQRILPEAAKMATVDQARKLVVMTIENDVMNKREGKSLDAPWKPGWRVPVGTALKNAAPKTSAEYVALWKLVVKGL